MFNRDGAVMLKQEKVALPHGKGYFKNVVLLTWLNDDMSTISLFGCVQCGYQDPQRSRVGIHVGVVHNGKKGVQKGQKRTPKPAISQVQSMLSELEAERDMWKAKARKYERQLRALRNALQVEA
jgi:protein-arginine kinase activator protein McsA